MHITNTTPRIVRTANDAERLKNKNENKKKRERGRRRKETREKVIAIR